jgi:hypothetical protein
MVGTIGQMAADVTSGLNITPAGAEGEEEAEAEAEEENYFTKKYNFLTEMQSDRFDSPNII